MKLFLVAFGALTCIQPQIAVGVSIRGGASYSQDDIASDAAVPLFGSVNLLRRVNLSRMLMPRVIFVAGLEGSGHHALDHLRRALAKVPGVLLLNVQFPIEWICGRKWSRAGIGALVQKLRILNPEPVWTFPMTRSYPECGTDPPRDMGWVARRNFEVDHAGRMGDFHPHLGWISDAAHEAQADLWVMFLYRPMEDALASACMHRAFESCGEEAEVLVSNAKILLYQMEHFDSNRIVCFEFGDLERMTKSVEVAVGKAAIDVGPTLERIWHDGAAVGKGKAEAAARVKTWPKLVKSMSKVDKQLLGFCNSAQSADANAAKDFLRVVKM